MFTVGSNLFLFKEETAMVGRAGAWTKQADLTQVNVLDVNIFY